MPGRLSITLDDGSLSGDATIIRNITGGAVISGSGHEINVRCRIDNVQLTIVISPHTSLYDSVRSTVRRNTTNGASPESSPESPTPSME